MTAITGSSAFADDDRRMPPGAEDHTLFPSTPPFPSYPAKAGYPVRRGFSGKTNDGDYWIVRVRGRRRVVSYCAIPRTRCYAKYRSSIPR